MTVRWNPAPTELVSRSVIMGIYGPTGSGKSSLALTAPGPVGLFTGAETIDGIVQKYSPTKDIYIHEFGISFSALELMSRDIIMAKAQPTVLDFRESWDVAVGQDGEGAMMRSVIVDTEDDLYDIVRYACFGDMKPTGKTARLQYGPVNQFFHTLLMSKRLLQDQGDICNALFVARDREVFDAKGQGTGKFVRAGQKTIGPKCNVIVRCSADNDGDFCATIEKAWLNSVVLGETLYSDDITFTNIMEMVTGDESKMWR